MRTSLTFYAALAASAISRIATSIASGITSGIRPSAGSVVAKSLAFTSALALHANGQNPIPVQFFYLPLPEGQLLQAMQSIEGGTTWIDGTLKPANPIHYYVSISSVSDGTIIYYDQMEDGYESTVNNPTSIFDSLTNPSGTQIWGDGNPENGSPPGIPSDLINAGSVIILNNPVDSTTPPSVTNPLFQAGDKIAATKAIAMTFAGWASNSATLLAGANEIFDTVSWGTNYRVPVGENIPDSIDFQMFQYTGAAIMAGEAGASVQIDANADGTFESTVTLTEGQSHLINGGLNFGAQFQASNPVQVDLITGDRQDGYESRFLRLLPTSLWATSYYSPVSTPAAAQGNTGCTTSVWLYNPGTSSINVTYQRRGNTNLISNVSNQTVGYASQPLTGSAPGNIYGPIVELNADGTLPGASPEGSWIGIVNRSASNTPTIESKVINAQNAGAAAVIIVNNTGGTTYTTNTAGTPVIPVVGLTQNDGAALRAAGLGAGWVRVSGDSVSSTVTVPAGSYTSQVLTDGYGAHFFTPSGETFYALSATDTGGTTLSDDTAGSNRTWDWGFTLVPESSLTPQVLIGLGIGRDPTSATNPNENGNPIWVTTTGNGNTSASVLVDYDSDPTTGPLSDSNGNKYDLVLTLRELEMAKVYNPSGNQTGMLLYTLDPGVKLAAAWGQDVLQSSPGQPGLDMGTGIPPLPQFLGAKRSVLFVDNDSDGYVSPGDILEYVITITNISRVPVSDLELEDVLPASVSYVPGTTTFKNSAGVTTSIPDALTGSVYPLDEGGIIVPETSLPPNGATWEIGYQTLVLPANSLPPGEFTIINSATIGGVSISDPIVLQESQPIYGQIGDRVWNDLDADGIQDAGEPGIPGITVRLLDASNNIIDTAITDGTGWYRFLGVVAGNYRVEFTSPVGYNFSPLNTDGLGLVGPANSDANPATGRSTLFSLSTGEHKHTIDAGLIAIVGPLAILKTSDVTGTVSPGDTINYTVTVTNLGATPQTGITITDILPNNTTYVPGSVNATITPPLDPGGTFVVNYTANDTFTVPANVTSLTVEAWGAGGGGGKSTAANNNAGGGGGGGGYARSSLTVTPGSSITVNVGTGGTASNNGGDSWFGSSTTVRGAGGLGGGADNVNGGSGGSSNIGNLATFNGGNGGNGHASGTNDTRRGGGGGGSATNTAIGGNGSAGGSGSGGGGGTGEANGGNGRQGSNNGFAGASPGGGGGGGGRLAIGGAGGNGRVRVTYTIPPGVAGNLSAPPNLTSSWTIPANGTLTVNFQATVNTPAAGTQVVNSASVTSNESPDPVSSTVFDTLTPGSITGFVLADTDGNGSGDQGIQGVTISLLNGAGNPILDLGGNPVTTTTGLNGSYAFNNLPPGSYQIVESQPSPYFSVSDADGGNPNHIGNITPLQLFSAQTLSGNNFIEVLPASVTGTVRTDLDDNGSGDSPLEGVLISLLDASGNPVLDGSNNPITDTTDEFGNYFFGDLLPGTYQIAQTQPTGYASVSDVDGTNPNLIGNTTPLTLTPGQNLTGRDFVEIQLGTISGTVRIDIDDNGSGDEPFEGVTLNLLDAAGNPVLDGSNNPITTLTDEFGNYSFTGVRPGDYCVTQDQPTNYNSVSDIDGANNNVIGDETPITVLPGQTNSGNDFVEIELGTISGFVRIDTDNNGTGDAPFPGVLLSLLDGSGNPILDNSNNPIQVATLPNGSYSFTLVPTGTYRVVQSQPNGYASVSDVDGANNNTIGDQTPIVMTPGLAITGRDFVEIQFASVTGTVRTDLDDNGSGDAPLEGVLISLLDASGNPVLDGSNTPITDTTDEFGNYSFENLLPGTYQIAQTQPTGYASVSDIDGTNPNLIGNTTPLTLTPGQNLTGRDFVEIQLGTISGFVFVNADPLGGVTLTLLDVNGDPVLDGNGDPVTTITAPDGSYSFTNVRPGTYQVGQSQPFGYESSSDIDGGNLDIIGDEQPIILTPGGNSPGNNFVETTDTCPDDWAQWKHQHPGQEADGNPDLDQHNNLTEFAFALETYDGSGDTWHIGPSVTFPGNIEAVFTRPKGATDNVDYFLEYAPTIGNPTAWLSLPITPLIYTVVDNGNCTETITILDLETLTGLIDGKGVVRIRAELDEENDGITDHISRTGTEGWKQTEFGICCQTYSSPYLRSTRFTGTIENGGVSGQTITLSTSAGSLDLDSILTSGTQWFAEITSGENEGHRFDIVSATGNTITLANDADLFAKEAPFNTLSGPLPSNLEGDTLVIRPHWTLAELFPPTGFHATDSHESADKVQVFSGGSWTIYWLYDDNGTPLWVDAAIAGPIDQGSTIIPPGQGLFFNNLGAATTLLAYGEVRENNFRRPLAAGSNLVSGGFPINQSATGTNGRAMTRNPFFGSRDFKTADSFFIWKGDATPGLGTYDTYYLLDGAPVNPSLVRWVRVGDSNAVSRGNELLFLEDRAVFTRNAAPIPLYLSPNPWSN